MPAPDGGDDFVGIGDPLEGFGLSVVAVEEAVDGGLKIDNRTEDATLQPALAQCGEESEASFLKKAFDDLRALQQKGPHDPNAGPDPAMRTADEETPL
jgi:hypothetical protein